MKLKSSNGSAFELKILGYQFPELETEEYDSNWLMVRVRISHARGSWTATDPCLLTYEVAKLADWLESVSSGTAVQPVVRFLEPNLEFHLIEADENGNKALRVCFDLELRPEWARTGIVGDRNLSVEFPLSEVDLKSASQELREQLSLFPQRAAK